MTRSCSKCSLRRLTDCDCDCDISVFLFYSLCQRGFVRRRRADAISMCAEAIGRRLCPLFEAFALFCDEIPFLDLRRRCRVCVWFPLFLVFI